MPSVDNRTVEMRFDNRDFEGGVEQSLGTIEKLKKSLKFKDAAEGFRELERASQSVGFSKLVDASDVVIKKFSALGTIGDQVLRRIGDQVYGLTTKMGDLAKSMSIDQITKGYDKYEQKTASVQTIINATGKDIQEVNKYLDRLMWYSDETSFGFTDMTQALQTMTSSGGDLEKLIPMLMGIGNATAFAGKGAGEFTRVMYNLNQAYSMGFLGTGDWRSIELAGASSKQLKETLLEVTKELGKGEYTMETFSEALTDKVFDKQVLEEAFGRFATVTLEAEKLVKQGVFDTASDAYKYLTDFYSGVAMDAATAAQEAKTFTEAIEATKDAVSSGWMTSFEYIFGDYVEAKRLWTWLSNELWDLFASGAEGRNEMLKQWHEGLKLTGNLAKDLQTDFATWDGFTFDVDGAAKGLTGYEMFIESLENLWEGFEGIVERGKEIFAEIIPPMTYERLMNITEGFHTFSEKFRDAFAYVTDVVEDTGIATVVETAEEAIDTLHDLDWWVEQTILGKFGNEPERFKRLLELGVNPELIQNAVNERLGSDYYNELIHGTSLYLDELAEAQDGVAMGFRKAEEAMADTVPKQKKTISNTEALFSVLRGVASVIGVVRKSAVALWHVAVDRIFPAIGRGINPILNYLGEIGEKLVDWAHGLTIESIEDKINSAVDWLASVKDSLASIISQARELPSVQRLLERWGRFKNWIGGIKDSAWEAFTGFFSSDTFQGFLPTEEKVLNWIDQLATKLDNFAALIESWNIPDKVKSWWGTIRDFFSGVFNYVGKFKGMSFEEITTTLWTDIQSLWQGFEEFINGIDFSETFAKLEEYARTVGDFFTQIWEIIFGSWGGTEETGAGGHTPDRKLSAVNMRKLRPAGPFAENPWITDEIEVPEPTVIDKLKEFLTKVAETIKGFLSTVTLQDIHTFGKALLELLVLWRTANMFKSIGGAFDKIGSFFGALNARVKPKVKQIKMPWLLQMAILIGVIVGSLKLLETIPWKTLKRVSIVLGALLGIVMLMGVVFSILGRFVLNEKKGAVGIDKMGTGMLMLGLTVLALAGSLKLLSTIKEEDLKGMWRKIVMLGVIFGAITVASMLLGKFGGAGVKQGLAMLMFAGSMVLLVSALEKLAKADLTGLKDRMPQILEAIVFLGLISWATKSASLSSGLGVTILILDILLLEWVLEKLAKVNTGDMFRGIMNFGIIAVLMGVLAGIMRIAGKNVTKINKVKDTTNITKSRSNMLQFAISMLIIAGTMLLMAEAIEKIGSIPQDVYKQGIAGVAGILAFFTALEGLSFATKNAKMIGFGVGMILTAVAVYGLGLAIQKIGTIPLKDFEQGYKAVMAIMGVMTAMMAVSRLSNLGWGNFIPVLIVLAAVMGGTFAMLKLLAAEFGGNAKYAEAVSSGVAEIIQALTGIFAITMFFNRSKLKTVKEGKKDVKQFGADFKAFAYAIITIFAIMAIIVGSMAALNKVFQGDTASFTAFAAGLSGIITALTPLFALIAFLTRPKVISARKQIANINPASWLMPLFSMLTVFAGIAAVGLLGKIPAVRQFLIDTADLLGALAGSFVTAFAEFASVHLDGSGLVTFAINLKTAIDTVASIFDNFDETTAGFTEFFGDDAEGSPLSNMMMALDNLVSFGLKLVEFRIVKGLMGKNLGGLGEFMQEIADSNIGARFNDLAAAVKDLTPEEIQKVNDMTGVLGALVQVQSQMVGFSDEWTSYTDTYTEAYDSVNGGLDKITQKKTGKKSLATRTLGIGDFVQLAEGLAAISESVGQVMDMIKEKVPDGDFSALTSMTEALGTLVDVQKKMVGFSNDYSSYVHQLSTDASGNAVYEYEKGFTSIADFVMGIGNLDEFSAQLPEVAQMFAKMVEEVQKANLTPESIVPITTMADALGALADVQTKLVGQNGEFSIDQFLHGFGNLTEFANQISGGVEVIDEVIPDINGVNRHVSTIKNNKSLGQVFKSFTEDVAGITPEDVENAGRVADIAVKLASIHDHLEGLEGFVQTFVTGKMDIGTFGEKISEFGVSLAGFSREVSGDNTINMDAIRDAVAATTLIKQIPTDLETTITDATVLKAFGDNLMIFSNALHAFGSNITDLGSGAFEDGAAAVSLLVDAFSKMQELDPDGFLKQGKLSAGVSAFSEAMQQLGNTSFDGFIDAFSSEESSGEAKSQGNILVQYISTGITENLPLITEAGKSIIMTLGSAIGTYKTLVVTATRNVIYAMQSKFNGISSKFYSYGMYAMQGLANGISSNAYLVIREANAVALKAATATSSALRIASPSKVFERFGMYIDQGLANGIRLRAYEAENASREMAESTLSGFQTIVSQIINAINNEWDDDMTIRPVLDLSEIQNGAARIGSLFGNGYTYTPSVAYARAAMANAGAAREEASAAQQHRSTVLVDEIRSMRQDIANLEYDMRNMQVVMQGGALVGQIGPKMSQWLDRNETLKNRGV